MAELTVQNIVDTGLEATFASAAGGGDHFTNDGKTFLWVKNGATDCNVTVTTQKSTVDVSGFGTLSLSNAAITVTATEERLIGPWPTNRWNDSSSFVQVTYDDVSNVTVAAIKLP